MLRHLEECREGLVAGVAEGKIYEGVFPYGPEPVNQVAYERRTRWRWRLFPTQTPACSEAADVWHNVMLDSDLAALCGVPTRVLNQAVRQSLERFPLDFMFQLTADEAARLRSQIVILMGSRGRYRTFLP